MACFCFWIGIIECAQEEAISYTAFFPPVFYFFLFFTFKKVPIFFRCLGECCEATGAVKKCFVDETSPHFLLTWGWVRSWPSFGLIKENSSRMRCCVICLLPVFILKCPGCCFMDSSSVQSPYYCRLHNNCMHLVGNTINVWWCMYVCMYVYLWNNC